VRRDQWEVIRWLVVDRFSRLTFHFSLGHAQASSAGAGAVFAVEDRCDIWR
jgi:hypothetical protein